MKKLDRFDIGKPIARGGYATVFAGLDPETEEIVAIKIVPRTGNPDENATIRFRREVEVLKRLSHPNLIRILDAGEKDRFLYYVMPFIKGGRLGSMLRQLGRPFPVERTLSISRDLASALAYVHDQGVLHRDIKVDNVMLTEAGQTILMDFGLIKLAGSTNVTRKGELIGTLCYVSPEQIEHKDLTPASDVYQLGLLMFECLTCRKAIVEEESYGLTMRRILDRAPEPPSILNPEVPGWLDELVIACSRPDPADRPPTAADVLSILEAYRS